MDFWRQRGQSTANRFPTAAHWAEGGGENQPPFKGWFTDAGCSFPQMDMTNVIGWSPIYIEVASNTPFWVEPYRSLDAAAALKPLALSYGSESIRSQRRRRLANPRASALRPHVLFNPIIRRSTIIPDA